MVRRGKRGVAADGGEAAAPARVPAHRVRHDGWTGERQRGFLNTLARTGNVRDACRSVGMSNVSAYRLRRVDAGFGEAWDAACRRASVSLEAVAYARAVEGVEEAVIRDGREVSRRRRYSDSLLRLLLQGSNPEKYGRTSANPSVQAREALEARVAEIEAAAFNRAWRALVAEYRFLIEPDYIALHIQRQLTEMHARLCTNPWCADCHPERAGEESFHPLGHAVPTPHEPLTPLARWLCDDAASGAIAALPPVPSWADTLATPPPQTR